jgi:hypothetical protein
MKKATLLSICLCWLTIGSKAQFNPSFEDVDSTGNLIGWTTQAGTIARATVRLVSALPFVATHRNHFVELIDDTSGTSAIHARMNNRFAFSERPRSLALDYLYIPRVAGQAAHISLRFFNSTVDTILVATFAMQPVFDSVDTNAIRVAWQTLGVDLDSLYQNSEMPDSAEVTIGSTNVVQSATAVRLFYLDNLRFGPFLTGNNSPQLSHVQVYPNPATNWIKIEGIQISRATLQGIDGKIMLLDTSGNTTLNLSHIAPGFYLLTIVDQQGNRITKKIYKKAGE